MLFLYKIISIFLTLNSKCSIETSLAQTKCQLNIEDELEEPNSAGSVSWKYDSRNYVADSFVQAPIGDKFLGETTLEHFSTTKSTSEDCNKEARDPYLNCKRCGGKGLGHNEKGKQFIIDAKCTQCSIIHSGSKTVILRCNGCREAHGLLSPANGEIVTEVEYLELPEYKPEFDHKMVC